MNWRRWLRLVFEQPPCTCVIGTAYPRTSINLCPKHGFDGRED